MNKQYDVIVVGSGAAGSFAAMGLTEQGLEVLLLEAGRAITADDFPTNLSGPKEKGVQLWARIRASFTGQPLQSRVALYAQQMRHLFVKDSDHPYTTDKDAPFLWIRGKQLGGRLHTFGRVLLRWSDGDFKAASRDGYGEDWPISYADLEPYYARAEETLGVRGCSEGIASIPDGKFAGPSKLTAAERDFKLATESHWPGRKATSWRYMPPNIRRVPVPILKAQETGKLTVRSDAVARRILTDPATGRATGAEFVDRETKQVHTVHAGAVMVCASAIESVRLLFNSAGGKHPEGLGNNSGNLGRYFMDQVPCIIMGTVPGRKGWEADDTVPADPFYGVGGGVYIPRWENVTAQTNSEFLRGYGYQGTVGRLFSPADKAAKFGIMGFGEMLPDADNRITLNPSRKDAWGVPIPHIRCKMGENDLKVLRAQSRAIYEMAENAGLATEFVGNALGLEEHGRGVFPDADIFSRTIVRMNFAKSMAMGAAIHESGGARMGTDPATSVLNAHNQVWDAPNVFVTDASSFMTGGTSGTTLTIMALTLRACRKVAEELTKGQA
ncbi:oxidoreductase [Sphingomonas sp. LH128]|uniref:Oxidoreductase n=1 Tax=Novosphingobium resinovorum TaxID=158500 RepID=A0A1D8AFD0_9SPHN|nr:MULTISPECIES: GMC family oxidoreductase [Sphingomonadaceae]AOR80826.1 oxidoreductase [Novosphingobium resinovorum]EJU08931.1 oxidoreductase [Sphingomonas sp. LH128]